MSGSNTTTCDECRQTARAVAALEARVEALEGELSLVAMLNNMDQNGNPDLARLTLESRMRDQMESPFSPAQAFAEAPSYRVRPVELTMYGMSVRHYTRVPTPGVGCGYKLILRPRPGDAQPSFSTAFPPRRIKSVAKPTLGS